MKKQKQPQNKKQTVTKNVDFAFILNTAVGNKNMQNIKDYGIEIVASDESLANQIDSHFAEAGAHHVKTTYLAPVAPVGKTGRPPERTTLRLVKEGELVSNAKESIPTIEQMPVSKEETVETEIVEEAPVEEVLVEDSKEAEENKEEIIE